MPQRSLSLMRFFLFVLSTCILAWSITEFYGIAWGTGVWLGQLALTWALALILFGLFCILCLIVVNPLDSREAGKNFQTRFIGA
jgi:hypothetical protein